MARLTTTSYAILGLLALREWSTYELAKQMERSLHNFWPRAESKLYEEPKKLVEHGLAKARQEQIGARPRTIYSITPKGRRALRAWLDEPGSTRVMEYEALLKIFFADQGSKEQLLANIDVIAEHARAERERGLGFAREYLETGGPFPERLHIVNLMVAFLEGQERAITEWARWARSYVEQWPEDMSPPLDLSIFREIFDRGEADVAAR